MRRIPRTLSLAFMVMIGLGACASPATLVPSVASTAVERTTATALPPTPAQLPSLTPIPTAFPGGLYVDALQDLGAISPLVFGSNFGPRLFVTADVLPQAKAAKITYLRFPDGNWGDLNDLDEWQIDQFITLCKQLGASPAISVRLNGGSPEKAAALVRLVNVEKKYGVRYWSIGNEPSLYQDYDTQRYNRDWRQYAEAMRAVDPSILLVGPDIHQYTANPDQNPKDSAGRDWMEEFLKANGDRVDIVSIHRYPFPRAGGDAPTKEDLRANSQEWDQIIPALRAQIRAATGKDMPVAVTEINSSWVGNTGGEATMDSYYNAIWWGDVLGRLIRQGVDVVAQFELVDEFGLMGKDKVYPIYYVYILYGQFGQQRVYASSDIADVSLFAAKRADGALTLMFINLSPEDKQAPLKIDGFAAERNTRALRLDASHNAEAVDLAIQDGKVELPAESITLIILEKT
mgnify:CR=1 FL=1